MAVCTDFFVATEDELRAAFPNRFPVADKPVMRQVTNPFTGMVQTIEDWLPAGGVSSVPAGIRFPSKEEFAAVGRLPIAHWTGCDQVKLAKLQRLVSGGDFMQIVGELFRLALIATGDDSSQLFRLSENWIRAIASIQDFELIGLKWAATEECQLAHWNAQGCSEVIESLCRLAQQAIAETKGMFLWVNV